MAKPRRPRGPRSTWESKAAPVETTASALESPTLESPAPAIESPIDRPVEASAPASVEGIDAEAIAAEEITADAGEEIAREALTAEAASPAVAAAGQSVAIVHAVPSAFEEDAAAEAAPFSEPIGPSAPLQPMRPVAAFQMTFSPERIDLAGIGDTITGYMRGESAAAAAYMRALGSARSPADMIRLQVGEFQRAADASLTCWSQVARKASRAFA